jgi:transcriptional regulator with XRE-family HTH domain
MTPRKTKPTRAPELAALAALVRRHGATELAKKLGTTARTVERWADGSRSPLPRALSRIKRLLAKGAPTPDAGATPPGRARSQADGGEGGPEAPGGAPVAYDALGVSEDTLRRLRRELDRLEADPLATSRERAAVTSSLTQATRLHARLTGVLELSESAILRAPRWRAIEQVLVAALTPFPEALDAAAKALRAMGGAQP